MKKIGIICAMQVEADAMRARLTEVRDVNEAGFSFTLGKAGDKEVILGLSGMGKVAAAVYAQTMILRFAPDALINAGVAGSLTDQLEILDMALSTALVEHDMDTTPLGDPYGFLSGPDIVEIPADPALLAAAEAAAREEGIRALSGMIASGDQFIATREQKQTILSRFPAIACEMEGAAVAHTAFLSRTPVLIIRAISDSFTGKNEMDYAQFKPLAAQLSARLVLATLKRL
ncbi:MAG: 5'-methylthioadenosine/adenosylhomocysteine nucleosidase [Clostridia bacterium]|nr:5'-methylthioadenosine/adenosylhomocysteine nucleosidase [Clostridia bacterium]